MEKLLFNEQTTRRRRPISSLGYIFAGQLYVGAQLGRWWFWWLQAPVCEGCRAGLCVLAVFVVGGKCFWGQFEKRILGALRCRFIGVWFGDWRRRGTRARRDLWHCGLAGARCRYAREAASAQRLVQKVIYIQVSTCQTHSTIG